MGESFPTEPGEAELARILGEVATHIADLWSARREPGCTPRAALPARLDAQLPEHGCALDAIPGALTGLLRGATPCGGDPLDFAHIPSTGNPAALIADAFASTVNLQSASAGISPLAVDLERLVLRWLAQFIGYGEPCGGLLCSGSSLANLTALTAARDAALPSARSDGLSGQPPGRLYASREVHACIARAARLLGLGESGLVDVSGAAADRIDAGRLANAVACDRGAGRLPIAVVATLGTTGTGAIDPLAEVLDITRREQIWLHVDGAYGAPAAAVDAPLAALLAQADSLALDLHKWLFLPYEAGVLLVRDPARLAASFSFSADYLAFSGDPAFAIDPMQLGPELSRGLRALRVWATFHWAGAAGLRSAVKHNLALAHCFHEAIASARWLEPCQPPALSVVCLRLRNSLALEAAASDALHLECRDRLAGDQPSFRLSTIRFRGRLALRACFVNPRTERSQVLHLVAALEDIARDVMRVTQA